MNSKEPAEFEYKPLYSREVLITLDKALHRGVDSATFIRYVGRRSLVREQAKDLGESPPDSDGQYESRRLTVLYGSEKLRRSPSEGLAIGYRPWIIFRGYSYLNRSLSDLQAAHKMYQEDWDASKACRDLKVQLLSTRSLQDTIPIQKVICFALGSFSSQWELGPRRSHTQVAAAQTIVSVLQEMNNAESIPCYIQDPAYSDTDKEFLRGIGFTPLDDPRGFLEVNSNTLVLSIGPEAPVRQLIAGLQWPAGFICQPILSEEEELAQRQARHDRVKQENPNNPDYQEQATIRHLADPTSPGVQAMFKDCYAFPFPQNESFGNLVIYLRKRTGTSQHDQGLSE